MPGYGYKQRTDPARRAAPGGPDSRVMTPTPAENRRTDIVSKTYVGTNPPLIGNVDDFYHFPRQDLQMFVGKGNIFAPSSTFRWNADIHRYSRNMNTASTAFAERFQIGMEARAIVDPIYPPSGILVKVQDLVRAKFTGPINAQFGKAVFIMAPQAGSSAPTLEIASIGWRAVYTIFNQVPTWKTQFVSKNGAISRSVDSGALSDVPRLLSWTLDGRRQEIRWYLDGILVDTFAPAAGDVGGQNTAIGRDSVQYICNCSDAAATSSFDYLMLGAPLVTVQFPDG